MKLQLNESGSWRNVLTFNPEQRANVEDTAAMLVRAAGGSASLSILDDAGARVAICSGPDFVWKTPHWRLP